MIKVRSVAPLVGLFAVLASGLQGCVDDVKGWIGVSSTSSSVVDSGTSSSYASTSVSSETDFGSSDWENSSLSSDSSASVDVDYSKAVELINEVDYRNDAVDGTKQSGFSYFDFGSYVGGVIHLQSYVTWPFPAFVSGYEKLFVSPLFHWSYLTEDDGNTVIGSQFDYWVDLALEPFSLTLGDGSVVEPNQYQNGLFEFDLGNGYSEIQNGYSIKYGGDEYDAIYELIDADKINDFYYVSFAYWFD